MRVILLLAFSLLVQNVAYCQHLTPVLSGGMSTESIAFERSAIEPAFFVSAGSSFSWKKNFSWLPSVEFVQYLNDSKAISQKSVRGSIEMVYKSDSLSRCAFSLGAAREFTFLHTESEQMDGLDINESNSYWTQNLFFGRFNYSINKNNQIWVRPMLHISNRLQSDLRNQQWSVGLGYSRVFRTHKLSVPRNKRWGLSHYLFLSIGNSIRRELGETVWRKPSKMVHYGVKMKVNSFLSVFVQGGINDRYKFYSGHYYNPFIGVGLEVAYPIAPKMDLFAKITRGKGGYDFYDASIGIVQIHNVSGQAYMYELGLAIRKRVDLILGTARARTLNWDIDFLERDRTSVFITYYGGLRFYLGGIKRQE